MTSTSQLIKLDSLIRDIPDFPKKGILFKDITPLLQHPRALQQTADELAAPFSGEKIDLVVAIESRGFIFGSLVAARLGAGFAPIRKPGKLPYRTVKENYSLEYGTDSVEIHEDAIHSGQRVLAVDDLIATGGTVAAACRLVRKLGGEIVGAAFVVELCFLKGREKLDCHPIHSLIKIE